ncbi:hypothetical protein N9W84_01285 [bacterium]|nr:hypothetical protein [bacterium]
MKTNKERLKLISRIYKIAADECVVEGLEFIDDDYDKVRELYRTDSNSTLNNKKLKAISDKILNNNYIYSNEETEEEYKQYLTSICLKGLGGYSTISDQVNKLFETDLRSVLEKTDAPFFENYKYLIEFAKIILKRPKTTAKDIIEDYDKKLSKDSDCWDLIIDEKLLEKLESKYKEKRTEKRQLEEDATSAEAMRQQIRQQGEAQRLLEEQEASRLIAETEKAEAEAAEAKKKEREDIQRLLEEDFSQDQIDRDFGITPSDIENADEGEVQGILNSMLRQTDDPTDRMKIRDLQQRSLRTSIPKSYKEKPQSSGFFSSAIRRKMRLLKK